MPHTIDDALSDPLVTVVERDDEIGWYTIRLGDLKTNVSIDLGRLQTSDRTKFRTSHVIHTPLQNDAYRTSLPFADYWAYALHRAISGLTDYYNQAVAKGHTPSENWLVKY